MPQAILDLPARLDPPRKRWIRAECAELEASGLLVGQKLELIEGELIKKVSKNRPHVNSGVLLLTWLIGIFGGRRVISEGPIDVAPEDNPTSEPEPDLVVLASDISHFTSANPGPNDLQLVIEISESTLYFDLTTKAALYARAGITEYWVLDTARRRMILHRAPQAGHYSSVVAYGEQESVFPLAAPESFFRVGDAFPEKIQ